MRMEPLGRCGHARKPTGPLSGSKVRRLCHSLLNKSYVMGFSSATDRCRGPMSMKTARQQ
ncbi:hypothetical protein F750_1485 [Streptomyces sp. PAMC 26508]|nr:hypothetical protein F750_1485 [Streptomyces sp. PAMC 26508]